MIGRHNGAGSDRQNAIVVIDDDEVPIEATELCDYNEDTDMEEEMPVSASAKLATVRRRTRDRDQPEVSTKPGAATAASHDDGCEKAVPRPKQRYYDQDDEPIAKRVRDVHGYTTHLSSHADDDANTSMEMTNTEVLPHDWCSSRRRSRGALNILKRLATGEKSRYGLSDSWEAYFIEAPRLPLLTPSGMRQYEEWGRVLVREGDIKGLVSAFKGIMVRQDMLRIPAGPFIFRA